MKNSHIKYPIAIFLSFFIFAQSIFAGPPPDLVAQSAILIERSTGTVLYQKNAYTKMYPASTTKILTAILSLENLDLYDHMTKTEEATLNVPSDSSHIGLEIGDFFPIIDGIYAVMLGSDNYISYDLATVLDGSIEAFANRMNIKARDIGASNSHFVNPHGYHDPGHYTTAQDLATIMNYALNNEDFRTIIRSPDYILQRFNHIEDPIEFSNTVKLIDQESPYYHPYVVGGKTGYTQAAGRSLVAAASKDDMELVGVVLKSTHKDFFHDMNTLFNYGFENFALNPNKQETFLENNSFSPWAKDMVDFALKNQLIDHTTQSYQGSISKQDFTELLMRTVHIAENRRLEDFSSTLAISHALESGLIDSDSLLSGFNQPINREASADLTAKLLSSLNYNPTALYPLTPYEDKDGMTPDYLSAIYYLQQRGLMGSAGGYFSPKENLTYESALSIATKLYKRYSISPYSSVNRIKKRLL